MSCLSFAHTRWHSFASFPLASPTVQPPSNQQLFFCLQSSARAAPREAPGSRGHARRDGAHLGRHAARGADRPGAVEAEAPPLLQCEPRHAVSVSVCHLRRRRVFSPVYNGIRKVFQSLPADSTNTLLLIATDCRNQCSERPAPSATISVFTLTTLKYSVFF